MKMKAHTNRHATPHATKHASLAGCVRKPLAVFMTATLAFSTVPVFPFAQAISAAAEENGGSSDATSQAQGNTQAQKAAASSQGSVTWNPSQQDAPTVTFDAHPKQGEDGSGSVHISAEDVSSYLLGANAVKTEVDKLKQYTGKQDSSALGSSINDVLYGDKGVEGDIKKDPGKYVDDRDPDYEALRRFGAYVDDSLKPSLDDVTASVSSLEDASTNLPNGVQVVVNGDNSVDVMVSKDATSADTIPVSLKVKSVKLSWKVSYSFQIAVNHGSGSGGLTSKPGQTYKDVTHDYTYEPANSGAGTSGNATTGKAGDSSTSSNAGISTSLVLDVKANQEVKVPVKDLKSKLADDNDDIKSAVTKNLLDTSAKNEDFTKSLQSYLNGDLTSAITKDVIPSKAESPDSDFFRKVSNVAVKDSKLTYKSFSKASGVLDDDAAKKLVEDHKADGLEIRTEKGSGSDGDSIVIKATKDIKKLKVPVKLKSVTFAYSFTPTYDLVPKDDAAPYEGKGTKQGDASADTNVDAVSLVDAKGAGISAHGYWDGVADKIRKNATYDNANKALRYRGDSQNLPLFSAQDGLTGELSGTGYDAYVTPTVASDKGAYSVNLAPKGAMSNPSSFTITWKYPDGQEAGTTTVSVGSVAPYDIDLASDDLHIELPFRLATSGRQMGAIASGVNAYVEQQTNGEVKDYISGVKITDEDAYYAAESADVTLAADDFSYAMKTSSDSPALANYNIKGTPKVTIKKMEQIAWADDNVTLSGKNGDSDITITASSWGGTWTREVPRASWGGHKLSYGARELPKDANAYEDNPEMSAGDGSHQNIWLYAYDTSDGDNAEVITEVTGVGYKLDRTAPVINSASVQSEDRPANPLGGIFFGGAVVNVSLSLTDAIGNVESGSDDVAGETSGLNEVSATYDDNESGRTNIDSGITGDPGSGAYSFTIHGDADVDTKDIHVVATDHAGNVMDTNADQNRGIPIEYTKLVADASEPRVSTSWDNTTAYNGKYYNANRTFTITIDEEFFNYVQEFTPDQVICTVRQDGQAVIFVRPGDFTEESPNHWVYSLPFTSDGDWEVSDPEVSDIIGRMGRANGDSFVIDKTAPTMQVTFDNNDVRNGKYYNTARTATVSVTERNFSPDLTKIYTTASSGNGEDVGQTIISGWTTNGDVHTATVTFPGQGVYTLSVNGEDLATNKLTPYQSPEFVVDTIKPDVKINGVANREAYQGDVAPSASIHDTNLDASSSIQVTKVSYPLSTTDENPYTAQPATSLTDMAVAYGSPSAVKEHDGVYTITVQAVDLAGNTDSQAITWSVNRFGSTYVLSDDTGKMVNKYLTSDKVSDVMVTEINPSGLDEAKTAVELTRDTENVTLERNKSYTASVNTDSGWHEYTYTVNRDNYDKQDGTYRVLFHSQDTAGNVSENTMDGKGSDGNSTAEVNFAVDNTKPYASFVDLSSGGRYQEPVHTAKVNFEDNIKLDHAIIKVNGQTYAELNADQLAASATHEVNLPESKNQQDVSVVVYDAAGNVSDELKATNVLVTTDPITLWLTNTPLFVASLVALAAIIGGIVVVVVKRSQSQAGNDPSGLA